jgi:hypothetical protein
MRRHIEVVENLARLDQMRRIDGQLREEARDHVAPGFLSH